MLSRRSSSLTTSLLRKRSSFLLKLKGDKSLDKPSLFPSPRVPTEILDVIIEFFIESMADSKFCAPYAYIVALTLVSTDFRQLALRHYFRHLMLLSRRHWASHFILLTSEHDKNQLRRWSGGFSWVKSLCSSSTILSYQPERLGRLSHLNTLSIDFGREGLVTQYPHVKQLLNIFESSPSASSLISLTLSSLPAIDVLLLRLIAKVFGSLTDLYLSSTERLELTCCNACYEESLSRTVHSPIPDVYLTPEKLATEFALALTPLQKLTHLHIGIFLSPEKLLESHSDHSELVPVAGWGWDVIVDCKTCKRFARGVRHDELVVSSTMAQYLKSLKSIGWSTCFSRADDLENQKTKPGPEEERDDEEAREEDRSRESSQTYHDDSDTNVDDSYGDSSEDSDSDEDIRFDRSGFMKTTILVSRANKRIRVTRLL